MLTDRLLHRFGERWLPLDVQQYWRLFSKKYPTEAEAMWLRASMALNNLLGTA
jgi:hypothetical protein